MGKFLINQINELRQRYGVARDTSMKEMEAGTYPRVSEPSLVHPVNSSIVKIRENGMIDLFVGTDNGIRIDPRTKTINIIGNIYRERVHSVKSEIKRDADIKTGGNWTLQASGNVSIESRGNLSLKGRKITLEDMTGSHTLADLRSDHS